jgi:hypothetical protein
VLESKAAVEIQPVKSRGVFTSLNGHLCQHRLWTVPRSEGINSLFIVAVPILLMIDLIPGADMAFC